MDFVYTFFLLSLLASPSFPIATSENELQGFYKSIITHQAQATTSLVKINKLYATIQEAKTRYAPPSPHNNIDYGKDSSMTKLYATVQEAKTGYGPKPSPSHSPPSPSHSPHNNINLTVYHLYDDIDRIGRRMSLFFGNQGPTSAILRKARGNKNISQTICGSDVAVVGEERICVSSLEEMLGFVHGILGRKLEILFTSPSKWQTYTVTGAARIISTATIGCHKMRLNLPFAVYTCHHIQNSIIRAVPVIGADEVAIQVFSVCHMDTSSWDPNHLVFRILKVKPGVPVCHFLTTDDIIWVGN